MINQFKKGPDYTDVNFDEYVVIDTPDKGNDDNGKIYKRGYNYQDELGGAQYICQIKGAGGASPHLLLTTIKDIEQMQAQEDSSFSGKGEYSYINNNLVPGKNEDGTFNDSIKWAYCSVKNKDGMDTISYIGFTFPFSIIDYEAESVDPYYNRDNETSNFINTDLIERIDDKSHPFYEKWKIKVPKGKKGDSIQNFRVIEANDSVEQYDGQEDDIENKRKIIVCDVVSYDKDSVGNKRTIYIGDYNIIDNIVMDKDGVIKITYTHQDDQIINVIARWITAVHLSEDGKLTIDYTTGQSTEVENTIKWIKNISMSEEGNLVVYYNDGSQETIQDSIKWISNIELTDNGQFRIEFGNNIPAYETTIKFPNNVSLDTGEQEGEGSQKFQISYNDGTNESIGNPINYIMKIALTQDDYHVLLLYSDPAKRQEVISQGKNREYEGRNDWYDLGAVKDASGILIGTNYELSHFTDGTSNVRIINQLNQELPEGFPESDINKHGKIVTVGDSDDQKKFFAFDYDTKEGGGYKGWYYVGDASAAGPVTQTQGIIVGREDDESLIEQAEDLPIGTVWLIVED